MRRRAFLSLIGGATALPLAAYAQQSGKVPRIGFLGTSSAAGIAARLEGFRQGLRDVGYLEGTNITVDYHWLEGRYERLPEMAADLVRSKPDLIVTHATPTSLALKRATTTIPIVFALVGDPVSTGIVASVARPGGNITGQSFFNAELRAKRVELLKEILPRLDHVAVILNVENPAAETEFQTMEATAKPLNVTLSAYRLQSPSELVAAFEDMEKKNVQAVEIGDDQLTVSNLGAVLALATRARLLTVGPEDVPRNGGAVGYGVDTTGIWRHVGAFVDKILKGTNPGDLPIERATKFQFILNLKTAKALGIEVPAASLLRADEVIE
jgi:putative ABC transport system substrate-binding protein